MPDNPNEPYCRQVSWEEIQPYARAARRDNIVFRKVGPFFALGRGATLYTVACIDITLKEAELASGWTAPEYRGAGHHSRLMQYMLRAARDLGYRTIIARCRPASLGIHVGLGAIPFRKFKQYIWVRHNLRSGQ
jgi:GNAT superfamily N-acetyltransferase